MNYQVRRKQTCEKVGISKRFQTSGKFAKFCYDLYYYYHDLCIKCLELSFFIYIVYFMFYFLVFYYDSEQLEKQLIINPNLLYRTYKEVNILITVFMSEFSRQLEIKNKDEIYHS